MGAIEITRYISIDESEIDEQFMRSSGPGGQNVNKVATAVQIRFNIDASKNLPEYVKQQLKEHAGNRINQDGYLVIRSEKHRTQAKNRQEALSKLILLIEKASRKKKKRIKTKPSRESILRRLRNKKRISDKKKNRAYVPDHHD
ncbi:aminoacyl-tRNA hydrolase [candidate division KSB1 bacterium]|nr:aminoacyl-tRNA hydrolase [candidate division KSB1 bacterium]